MRIDLPNGDVAISKHGICRKARRRRSHAQQLRPPGSAVSHDRRQEISPAECRACLGCIAKSSTAIRAAPNNPPPDEQPPIGVTAGHGTNQLAGQGAGRPSGSKRSGARLLESQPWPWPISTAVHNTLHSENTRPERGRRPAPTGAAQT